MGALHIYVVTTKMVSIVTKAEKRCDKNVYISEKKQYRGGLTNAKSLAPEFKHASNKYKKHKTNYNKVKYHKMRVKYRTLKKLS